MRHTILAGSLLVAFMSVANVGQAGMITTTLGNNASGFNDGDTPTVPEIGTAQAGQPAPFNTSKGADLLGPNLSESWTFNYGAIADPILSASLTLGIVDHDSSATGDQLSLFEINNNSLFTELNTLFEAAGGSGDKTYKEYSINLPNSFLAGLAPGTATVELDLTGPGLLPDLFGGGFVESSFNGAFLIFSTLTIETEDEVVPEVPTPPALALALLGFGMMAWRRRRSRPVA